MKVKQQVRRKTDDKELDGEPKWIEDDIYEDVAIEKAYVGRVRRILSFRPVTNDRFRSRSCCVRTSV
jgi:hypothetical protein